MDNESDFPLIPEHERSYAERYRLASMAWCEAMAEASRRKDNLSDLDDRKTARFETIKRATILSCGPMTDAAAEREAKTSQEWMDVLDEISAARSAVTEAYRIANHARAEMDALKMAEHEWGVRTAAHREEMRLSR